MLLTTLPSSTVRQENVRTLRRTLARRSQLRVSNWGGYSSTTLGIRTWAFSIHQPVLHLTEEAKYMLVYLEERLLGTTM